MLFLLTGCIHSKDANKVLIGIIRVPNDTVVAIQNKWIEEEFEKLGLEVEFRFFDSGVAMNQAFASGAVDIAEMGFTNGVVAMSKNLPVELFWIHDVIEDTEALVVKDESIQDVSELKGKSVATILNSTSHLSLLTALKEAGLSKNDVKLLNMETAEIVAAWNRGDLDAAYTWEPTLSNIKDKGKILLTSKDLAESGLMTVNIGLVHKKFAENNREALIKFIESLDRAYKLKESDFDQVVRDASDYLEISPELVETQISGSKWLSMEELVSEEYMGQKFLEVFHETSKFWAQENFIDKELEMERIRDFINPEYIQEVIDRD